MKQVLVMAGACALAWGAAAALFGARTGVEILLGMIGPMAVASVAWVLMARTYTRNPEDLTSVMVTAFAAKIVFFGAYVTFMLKVLTLRPIPFMASFTSAFIVSYAVEAFSLRRLFMRGAHASPVISR